MDGSAKLELVLDGLKCANCANKIERQVSGLENVSSAFLNFSKSTLTIEVSDRERVKDVMNETKKIVGSIEPDVVVKEKNSKYDESVEDDDKSIKENAFTICVSVILTAAAVLMDISFQAKLVMYITGYLLTGGKVLLKAAKNIVRGRIFDENFLMSIATLGAFAVNQYPEAVSVMIFYNIGELFQSIAVDNSRKSIKSLLNIRPDYANKKVDGGIMRVSPEEIETGDIIVIKTGEKIPLDGNIIDGTSMIDTSALTGESVPMEVEPGNEVLGGFINKGGLLTVKVTKRYEESTVFRILDMVQNAGKNKAHTENFITKFARYYTPTVVGLALLLTLIPTVLSGGAEFNRYLYRSLVFLVISCPCALVISIPLSFFGGIGGASRKGILVKGGNYLEALNNVDTVVFDKTGTLTKGVFNVTRINAYNGISKDEVLKYAAAAESYSNHPIAASILKAYGRKIDDSVVDSYHEMPGLGVKTNIMGMEVLAGNEKLLRDKGIEYRDAGSPGTVVHLSVDGKYAGNIVISDEIKDDSVAAVKKIKAMGIKRTVMLTGDSAEMGNEVGKVLGIDEVYAGLLPDEKVDRLKMLKKDIKHGGKIVFAGDGINDAPVLAGADVGIAMGGLGSDAAIEAADVVIMTDEPSKIVDAIKVAKETRKIVWENIILSLGVKAAVLILGALGSATMWEAVFADVGVALIAVLNSMRAMRIK